MKIPHFASLLAASLLVVHASAQTIPAAPDPQAVVKAARQQIGVTVGYDAEYRTMSYPGGDVPPSTGVCTDVVTRALRTQGLDLQRLIHEDMARHFSSYPRIWGLKTTDSNIDHRRVPNLMTFFQRQGWRQAITADAKDYQTGDIVTWDLGGGHTHIGLVSDTKNSGGTPLVIHNIGAGTCEEDTLFTYKIIGHYRLPKAN